MVAFGETATLGLSGVVEAGLRVAASVGAGLLNDGAAFATTPLMLAVVPVERSSKADGVRWKTTAPLVATAWGAVPRLAPVVDDRDPARPIVELLLGTARRRFALYEGAAGIAGNLTSAREVLGAILRAAPPLAPPPAPPVP